MGVHRTTIVRPVPDAALTWGGVDAYELRLNLVAVPAHEMRRGGALVQHAYSAALTTVFSDVREQCWSPIAHPRDQVTFVLPKEALRHWAEEHAIHRTLLPSGMSGQVAADPVLTAFGLAAASMIGEQHEPSQFFVDHLLDGVCSHLFSTLGTRPTFQRGGLAPWQLRRAKEMMDGLGSGDIALADLARACGLSIAHFSRAFRQSCGSTPHRWLMFRRIERAHALMRTTEMSLAGIATECGFTDQAHLTNVFTKHLGFPPATLRRRWQSEAAPPCG